MYSALQLALRLCKRLGVLVADEKVEGPLTSLIFFSILLDTEAREFKKNR